jgi:hypothetical protein
MEWLVVLAALACPIGMLAMGAMAWVMAKRMDGGKGHERASDPAESEVRERALTPST